MNNIRDIGSIINKYFTILLEKPILINTGKKPNDCTADTIEEGLLKIVKNLKSLTEK